MRIRLVERERGLEHGNAVLERIAAGLTGAGHEITRNGADDADIALAAAQDAAAAPAGVALTACVHLDAPEPDAGDREPARALVRLATRPAVAAAVEAATGERTVVVAPDALGGGSIARLLEARLAERRLVLPTADGAMEAEVRRRFSAPIAVPPDAPAPPGLTSIVIPSWDAPRFTRDCLASVRAHTPEPHEVVVVDNGSRPHVAAWVREQADVAVLNADNRGVATALDQGAAAASGDVLVFLNSDTRVPPGWLAHLHGALAAGDDVGLVATAVTAGTAIHRRATAGTGVRIVHPFTDFVPAGIAYALRRSALEAAGGWRPTADLVASEDYELCFALWRLGYRVLVDDRVLVEHVCEGTSAAKLDDWIATYTAAGEGFLERWRDLPPDPGERFPGGPWRQAERALAALEADAGDASGAAIADLRAALAEAERRALAERAQTATVAVDLMARRDPRRSGAPWSLDAW